MSDVKYDTHYRLDPALVAEGPKGMVPIRATMIDHGWTLQKQRKTG